MRWHFQPKLFQKCHLVCLYPEKSTSTDPSTTFPLRRFAGIMQWTRGTSSSKCHICFALVYGILPHSIRSGLESSKPNLLAGRWFALVQFSVYAANRTWTLRRTLYSSEFVPVCWGWTGWCQWTARHSSQSRPPSLSLALALVYPYIFPNTLQSFDVPVAETSAFATRFR